MSKKQVHINSKDLNTFFRSDSATKCYFPFFPRPPEHQAPAENLFHSGSWNLLEAGEGGEGRLVEIAELWEPWQSAEDEGGAKVAPQACGALAKSHVVNHKDGVALRRKWASGIRTTVARHRFSDLAAYGSSVHRTHRTPARRVPSMQSITPGSAFSCTQLCSRGLFTVRSRVWFMLRPSLERSRQRRNRWCLLLLIYGCNKPCDYQSDEQLAPWHRQGREVARGFARCTVKWQVVQAESEKPWVRASWGVAEEKQGEMHLSSERFWGRWEKLV